MNKLSSSHRVGISGRGRAWVINPDGSIAQQTGWSRNLVLDSGFAAAVDDAFSALFRYCAVGTDNTTRTPNMTTLGQERARTGNCENVEGFNDLFRTDSGVTPCQTTIRRTFDYPVGVLDSSSHGLYYEAGLSWGENSGETLFSSFLFRDETDAVVGVAVSTEQILRIQYELIFTMKPDVAATDSFDITGIGTINYDHMIQNTEIRESSSRRVFCPWAGLGTINGRTKYNTSTGAGSSDEDWHSNSSLNGGREALLEPANPFVIITPVTVNTGTPEFQPVGDHSTNLGLASSVDRTQLTPTANITSTTFNLATLTYSKTWRFGVAEGNGVWNAFLLGNTSGGQSWLALIDDASAFTKEDTHELELTFNLVMVRE